MQWIDHLKYMQCKNGILGVLGDINNVKDFNIKFDAEEVLETKIHICLID